MECVTINPPASTDCMIVLQSLCSSHPTTATMTSCCGRHEACSGDQAGVSGKACEPRPGSCIQEWSAELSAAHWCGQAPVSVVLHCLGFSKTNSYWKGTVRTMVFRTSLFRRSLERKRNHFVFLWEVAKKKRHNGNFFFFLRIVVYEVRERESVKERSIENRAFWKALTMQSLCSDLVCPHRAEQRNGKDYPQECLGCPQTERAAWLANGSEACRAAG